MQVFDLDRQVRFMKQNSLILTNNPLVEEKRPGKLPVQFMDTDYIGVLQEARDRIHKGAVLLTHPLYGSVKPGETPYRSVLIREGGTDVDYRSLELIESSISTCRKFRDRTGLFRTEAVKDFQMIDLSLLMSGLEGFDAR